MGRYYSGDIEGKFWFGVQPSDDADFFGDVGQHPEELDYYFDEDDKDKVKIGVKKCEEELGHFKAKIDQFFKGKDSYNDKELAEYLKVDLLKGIELLQWYARLEMGQKILDCLNEQSYCYFTAEC